MTNDTLTRSMHAVSQVQKHLRDAPDSEIVVTSLAAVGIIIGIALRITPLASAGFMLQYPVNGGGLYWQFSRTILANGFAYPITIPYYQPGGLPFAYTPLVFYLTAALAAITPLSTYTIHLYAPYIISAATVPAMYVFSKELLERRDYAAAATLLYGVTPWAFHEYLVGDGLIEAAGALVFLIGATALVHLDRRRTPRDVLMTGGLLGGAVMTSPGGGAGLALVCLATGIVATAAAGHDGWQSAIDTLGVYAQAAVVAVVVSAPWWLTVSLLHSPDIILNGILVSSAPRTVDSLVIDTLLLEKVGAQRALTSPLMLTVVVIGMVACLRDRTLAGVTFGSLVALNQGESAYVFVTMTTVYVVLGATSIATVAGDQELAEEHRDLITQVVTVFLIGLIFVSLWGGAIGVLQEQARSDAMVEREAGEFAAMEHVRSTTPDDAVFLDITGRQWWQRDWFPAIAERTTVNVEFGTEVLGPRRTVRTIGVNQQLASRASVASVEQVAGEQEWSYTHVYLAKADISSKLVDDYRGSRCYDLVFENEYAAVFRQDCRVTA